MKLKKINKQEIFLFTLMVIAIFLSIGYAVFAQTLATDVKTVSNQMKQSGYWNVSFTDAKLDSLEGTATETALANYTNTLGHFYVSLKKPNDSATYDFTITNNGNLDAKVDSIIIDPATNENDTIIFTTSNLEVGDVLKAGESTHIKIKALYNPKNEVTDGYSKTSTVIVNFVQND